MFWCIFLYLIFASILAWVEIAYLKTTLRDHISFYFKELQVANSKQIEMNKKIAWLKEEIKTLDKITRKE